MKKIKSKLLWWGIPTVLALLILAIHLLLQPKQDFQLTSEEKNWLNEHPVIRIAPNPNFIPIEFLGDNGTYQGLAADIIKQIEIKTGIKFKIVPCQNQAETFEAIQSLRTDIISATAITPKRASHLNFSQPFIKLQKVIVVHKNDKRVMTRDSLKGIRVAVVKNSSVYEDIINRKIEAKLDTVSSSLETLYEVSFGRAEAGVVNLASAAYLIENRGLYNLRVAGDYSEKEPYVMAIRKDWPILMDIINKTLASIPQEQHDKIVRKWLGSESKSTWLQEIPWGWIVAALALIGILIIATLIWNRLLTRKVQAKTIELQQELNERQKIERDLRESENRFRQIIELLPEAVVITKEDGATIIVNVALCKMLGYSEEELLQKKIQSFAHPPEVPKVVELFYDKEEQIKTFETFLIKKDDSIIQVEATLMHTSIQGEPHYVALVRDISIRKQTEEKLLESRERLKELNAAKDKFFSIISHDLRSPFWGIIGMSEILLQPEGELSKEETRKIYQNLNTALKTQFMLLEDLLKWSRIQIGRLDIEMEVLDLRLAVHKVIVEVRKNAEHKKIEIKNEILEDLTTKTDENIILTVFRNLLSNAIKFTRRGGKIKIISEVKDAYINVLVIDDGIGMTEEQAQKLFRIDTVFSMKGTENEKGTGLGLILVKEMLDKVNGKISVESQLEKGAKFTVTLPIIN